MRTVVLPDGKQVPVPGQATWGTGEGERARDGRHGATLGNRQSLRRARSVMAQKERARAEYLRELDSIFDLCRLLLDLETARGTVWEIDPAHSIV